MGENHFAPWTLVFYGTVLMFAGIAYFILTRALLSLHAKDSVLATALGSDFKGKVSVVIYLVAIPACAGEVVAGLRVVHSGGDHVAHS